MENTCFSIFADPVLHRICPLSARTATVPIKTATILPNDDGRAGQWFLIGANLLTSFFAFQRISWITEIDNRSVDRRCMMRH